MAYIASFIGGPCASPQTLLTSDRSGRSLALVHLCQLLPEWQNIVKDFNLSCSRSSERKKYVRDRRERKKRNDKQRSKNRKTKNRDVLDSEPQMGMEFPLHVRIQSPPPETPSPELTFESLPDPSLIFPIDDINSSDSSEDEDVVNVSYGGRTRNFLQDDFKASAYQEFIKAPQCVKESIGPQRFFRLVDDIIYVVTKVENVPFYDHSRALSDAWLDLDDDDSSKYISYGQALTWTKIICDYTVCKLLCEYYRFNRAALEGGRDLRTPTTEQYGYLFRLPSMRACHLNRPSIQAEVDLIAWRASIDQIVCGGIVAMRLIASSGGRGNSDHSVMTPIEREFLRSADWFRRQNACIAIGAIYDITHVTPLPPYLTATQRDNLFIPVPQVGAEQLASAAQEVSSEDESMLQRLVSVLVGKARTVGSAVAGGAVKGFCDVISESGPVQFLASLTENAIAISKNVIAALTLVWNMLPNLAPLLGIFAAWRFSETGSVIWAVVAVGMAFVAGKKVMEWFSENIAPHIIEAALRWFGPRTRSTQSGTMLDNSSLTDEVDATPVGMFNFVLDLFAQQKEREAVVEEKAPDDVWATTGDRVVSAVASRFKPAEAKSGWSIFTRSLPEDDPSLRLPSPVEQSTEPASSSGNDVPTSAPPEAEGAKTQTGPERPAMSAEVLASLASTALLVTGLFVRDTHGIINIFLKFNGVALGFAAIIRMGLSIATYVIEQTETNVSLASLPFSSQDVPVIAYIDSLKEIFDLNTKQLIPSSPLYKSKIEALINDGQKLLSFSKGSPLNSILLSKLKDLEKIRSSVVSGIESGNMTRPEPIGVMLQGEPGTFKSLTLIAMAKAIVVTLLKDDPKSDALEAFKADNGCLVFNIPGGKHMDGYNERTLVVIDDDFLQELSTHSENSQGTMHVKLGNGMRYNPPMAELSFKNNVFVNHAATLVSTNINRIVEKTMADVTALTRRFPYVFEPVVPKGYDISKHEAFDPRHFTYRVKLIDHRQYIVNSDLEDVTFDQMVKMVLEGIYNNRKYHKHTETTLDQVAADFADKYEKLDSMVELSKKIRAARKAAACAPGLSVPQSGSSHYKGKKKVVPQVGPEVELSPESLFEDSGSEPDIGDYYGTTAEMFKVKLSAVIAIGTGSVVLGEDLDHALEVFDALKPNCYSMPYQDLLAFVRSPEFVVALPSAKKVDVPPITPSEYHQLTTGWRSTAGQFIENAREVLREYGRSLLTSANVVGVIVAVASALGLARYYNMWFGNEPQYSKKGATKGEKKSNAVSVKKRLSEKFAKSVKRATPSTVQAGTENQDIAAIAEGNRFQFLSTRIAHKGNQELTFKRDFGFINGVCNNFYVIPLHFAFEIEQAYADPETTELSLEIVRDGKTYKFTWDDVDVVSDVCFNKDRAVIRVNVPQIPPVRNVLKHYSWRNEIETVTRTISAGVRGIFCRPEARSEFELRGTPYIKVEGEMSERAEDLLTYRCYNRVGYCGTPLVISSGPHSGKIGGIHTHGNKETGHATIIDRNWLSKSILGESKEQDFEASDFSELSLEQPVPQSRNYFPDNVNVVESGVVPRSTTQITNDNVHWEPNGPDSVYKERIYGASITTPDRFTFNRAKFNPKTVVNAEFEKAVDPIAHSIVAKFKKAGRLGRELQILSFDQAVRGDRAIGLDPLRIKQSTGYPLAAKGINRSRFFAHDENGETIPKAMWKSLADDVAHLQFLGRQGIPLPIIWSIFLKAEKLKLKKIESGKTRDVNCAPLAFLVLCRMYMGDALALINEGTEQNECLINVDAASNEEWDALARRLSRLSGGKNCEAGDYEGFDHCHSLLTLSLPRKVFRLLYSSVSEPESRVIEAIFDAVSRPKLIFGDCIEQREGTMPSGFLGTTVTNCIINMGNFRFAWMALHDFDHHALLSYDDHIVSEFCGDDNIFEVSETYKDHFTPQFLNEVFTSIGYKYTSADKTAPKPTLSPLVNHTMLKRGFRLEKLTGMYVGPLDLERVLEIPMWTKSKAPDTIGADNCSTALGELALHGEEVFSQWAPKIERFARGFWTPATMHWQTVFEQKAKYCSWDGL